MTTARAGAFGYPPKLTIKPANPEKSKYLRLWSNPDYRKYSPGEEVAAEFIAQAKPTPADTVIDFGCGSGRGALMLAILRPGLKVAMIDFAENCLDDEVKQALDTQKHVLSYTVADIEKPAPVTAKYGFCADVMEHIPPSKVDTVIKNILHSTKHAFFQISLVEDMYGSSIGETLHLTIRPYTWWLETFRKAGGLVHWSRDDGNTACFYVSSWAKELIKGGTLNTPDDAVMQNIKSSLVRELQSLHPYPRQDTTIMLLAGGASLNDHWDEIKEKRLAGQPLVTTNGTYNQCIERGIKPSAQIIVDARDFNKRFVAPVLPLCKYMLASQCHPDVFDPLPPSQVLLWHSGKDDLIASFLSEWYAARGLPWFPVPGGSTVMLRAFPLLFILGFRRFEVYGFDSCLMGDAHHAYAQAENDGEKVVPITCGGREFQCHPSMASQAHEFMDLMQLLGDETEMDVKGDGLIAHILKTGAQLDDVVEKV